MLTITDHWLQSANLTEAEVRIELALSLLKSGRITFERAQELAQTDTFGFLELLRQRSIELSYDVTDFEQDIEMLKHLGQL